jgi:IPT/TIG domain/NHL repeat
MAAFCGAIILGIFWVAGFSGCQKSSPAATPTPVPPIIPPTPAPTPVTVTAVSPDTAAYSTVLTITGTGFSATASGDSVYINGVSAGVQQASTTQLVVSVPKGAGTGPVKVVVGTQSGIGPTFNYVYTVTVSTLAGTPFQPGYLDGNGTAAQFHYPFGVAVDGQGNVYVADYANERIRKVTPAGVVSTLTGSGIPGYVNGGPAQAEFQSPSGITVDGQGNVYVGDVGNNAVRLVTSSGVVTTLAGSSVGQAGYFDGTGNGALFAYPYGLAMNGQGIIYVADAGNNLIRDMSTAGSVGTFAGEYSVPGGIAQGGYADGSVLTARFYSPYGVTFDAQGNVYVADGANNRIRKVSSGVVSTLAGNGKAGYVDGSGTTAEFNAPWAVAVDGQGNVYVADQGNAVIRKITPSGVVSTLAGNGTSGHVDGAATTAEFAGPTGIALDAQGNIYVADQYSSVIRKITLQ